MPVVKRQNEVGSNCETWKKELLKKGFEKDEWERKLEKTMCGM